MFVLFSEELVLLILGEKWIAAAPVFQVLAVFGITQALVGDTGAVFLALKKQEYTPIITFVGILVMAILVVPFTYMFGLVGAGLAVVAGSLAMIPVILYFLIKLLK